MHKIEYKNCFSYWSEALPLGNGHFGCMGYLDPKEGLNFIFNHYDVHYKILWAYSKRALSGDFPKQPWYQYTFEQIKQNAKAAHDDPDHPGHQNYNATLNPGMVTSYGVKREGFSNPISGQLSYKVNQEQIGQSEWSSCLNIEDAAVDFKSNAVSIRSVVLKEIDVFVSYVSGACGSVEISMPQSRFLPAMSSVGSQSDENIFYVENRFYLLGEDKEKYAPFRYVFMIKILGAKGKMNPSALSHQARIDIEESGGHFTVLATVVTEQQTSNLINAGIANLRAAASQLSELERSHQRFWRDFFNRCTVHLPDAMLETLWHLHLYSLACCSGEGARIYQEACGLSGLWSIKAPSQWGTMWYWDVNIQQSFWPVFTSNHLELAKPFHKALLSHVQKAKQWAKSFYGIDGIAPDYPFDLMLCIWPWCAQYFWWYYTYSGDEEFLRNTAYPLFKDILSFIENYLQEDKDSGKVFIFPDISPEQGPVTRNSTITLSTWKYLIDCSIRANEILKDDPNDRRRWETILKKFPDYPTGCHPRIGTVLKDSEWSPPDLYLAHSSVLMPIYPVGELTRRTGSYSQQVLRNTLQYADESQCLGTHNLWLAPAAARLGLGDETYRLLYERGIAYMMRPNGMFAEETDRWIQNCLVACVPVYNPPLMEAGGIPAAAINEMLLQSFGGVIEVFPAIPKGVRVQKSASAKFDKLSDVSLRVIPAWQDCSFENLRAEGAFEVSAWLSGGTVTKVKIKSLKGNEVCMVNPFSADFKVTCQGSPVPIEVKGTAIRFKTQAGKVYELAALEQNISSSTPAGRCPMIYQATSGRRVFLGKDEHTDFYLAIDAATLDYYAGDTPVSKITLYKLDFTGEGVEKQYESVLPKQYHACGKQGLDFTKINKGSVFNSTVGIGWQKVEGLSYFNNAGPDCLRQDGMGSSLRNAFKIELAKGAYQLLVITGDANEKTLTIVDIAGKSSWNSGLLRAGIFKSAFLYFTLDDDSIIDIKFSSASGLRLKVNAMIVNKLV